MKTRGRGPFREEFYSVCSAHWEPRPGCHACSAGNWSNVYAVAVSGTVYRIAPRLWRWWVNRPGSRPRRQLEGIFPGLRGRL